MAHLYLHIIGFRTRRRNKIACMFVSPCGKNAHFTLLFSHGNAVDLGQVGLYLYYDPSNYVLFFALISFLTHYFFSDGLIKGSNNKYFT